jgi:hypothetical protein
MKHWKGQKQAKDINEIFFEKKKSSNLSFYFQTKKGFNDKAEKYEA